MGIDLDKQSPEIATFSEVPTEFRMEQNFPNPFNPSTQIKFQIAEASHVRLDIYDILGNKVATLVDEPKATGIYSVTWNAGKFASGVYIYQIFAGEFSATKKLLLVK